MVSVTATVRGSTWFLPFWIVMRAVPSGQNSTSFQVRAAASERRSPPSAITPTIARSMVPRACAVSADSMRPPRPRLGSRTVSRIRARARAVSASACWGAGATFRQPFMVSATAGWRAGVLGLGYSLRGMGVGDGGPGLIYGGHGLPVRRQVAQVEGDCLGFCGQCPPVSEDGPVTEELPCRCVGPACVGGLGIPQASGDGLGRILILFRQLQVVPGWVGGGEKGAADVLCFHGIGDSIRS